MIRLEQTDPAAGRRPAGEPAAARPRGGPVLITGGAGFVGTNLADALLRAGRRVRVFDSLGRAGVEENLRWLRRRHDAALEVVIGDVRDAAAAARAAAGTDAVFHLAGQVAVTTSLADPLRDFEVNARGTLNVLEALRARPERVPLVFTSTNKVYGPLEALELREGETRYEPAAEPVRTRGIGEAQPLAFHSPYGCSKGSADQYVLDYARHFGMPACVFRMSCIYGPHQRGNEDQGWVAHVLRESLAGRPIRIFGDGRQVRDLLFISDLVAALRTAVERMEACAGQVFNIGGGPERAVSLLELVEMIEKTCGLEVAAVFENWRSGDQRYYVSDSGRFRRLTGWKPEVGVLDGLARLRRWLEGGRVQSESETCTESFLQSNR